VETGGLEGGLRGIAQTTVDAAVRSTLFLRNATSLMKAWSA